jgi:hypothetical protein
VAMLLGATSPNPHPPSRSWATTAAAHLPDLKPQHEVAQSASEAQTPVMNWVPARGRTSAEAARATVGWHIDQSNSSDDEAQGELTVNEHKGTNDRLGECHCKGEELRG